MTQHNYIIPDFLNKQRIDKALAELCLGTSRSQIQKAIKNHQLILNGKIIDSISMRVKENDVVIIDLEEEIINENLIPANIPLDIVYEDDDLIVINKSSSMTVHPGAGNNNETLVNALLFHSKFLSDVAGDSRPGIVHRLDKNTSGLMVVAKNNKAHVHLANQIESRELMRQYKALVWGVIKPVSGEINLPIGRSAMDRKRMSVLLKGGGKRAVTHYNTTEILQSGLFSMVECKLETGRTHQIRVHLSHSKHSIVGDQTYGNNLRKIQGCPEHLQNALREMKHQALHSFYISFIHPTSEERMEFFQEIPENFNQLLNVIRQSL
ncbi:MAG: RluA family pseudouridine synthase [Rickettsiales bacterium]|nr:MAG: RluA family pseudouridine synthase [Rickettsiales bacterium]